MKHKTKKCNVNIFKEFKGKWLCPNKPFGLNYTEDRYLET